MPVIPTLGSDDLRVDDPKTHNEGASRDSSFFEISQYPVMAGPVHLRTVFCLYSVCSHLPPCTSLGAPPLPSPVALLGERNGANAGTKSAKTAFDSTQPATLHRWSSLHRPPSTLRYLSFTSWSSFSSFVARSHFVSPSTLHRLTLSQSQQ